VPNAFLSLFSSEAAAKDAINASPIRYRLISEPSQSPSPTASLDTSPAEEAQAEATETKPAEDEKIFELHVSHSDFDHALYLTSPKTNPLHGPFKPVDPKYSYIAASLDRSVPKSLWAAGLKDWETDSVKWRNGPVLERELEISQGMMGTSVAHRVAQRERRRREKAIPRAMSGLRALREERESRVGPKPGEEQG
jgi:hypothetical protein